MYEILIGDVKGQHVSIVVVCREREDAYDADDGNWLVTKVAVRAGAWSGKYSATMRSGDFEAFRKQLRLLYDQQGDVAVFESLEEWLSLKLTRDRQGRISVEGSAIDQLGIGNLLTFRFEVDQSYLPKIIAQLEAAEQAFPFRGI